MSVALELAFVQGLYIMTEKKKLVKEDLHWETVFLLYEMERAGLLVLGPHMKFRTNVYIMKNALFTELTFHLT